MNVHTKVKHGNQVAWDDETKRKMATIWNDGGSASLISARFGLSRTAVLGLVHRNPRLFKSKKTDTPRYSRTGGRKPVSKMFGEDRPKPNHAQLGNKAKNTRKARMEAVQREAAEFQSGTSPMLQIAPDDADRLNTGKEMIDLARNECRFGLNNSHPFIFCAAPTEGAVYCPHHSMRAYVIREAR